MEKWESDFVNISSIYTVWLELSMDDLKKPLLFDGRKFRAWTCRQKDLKLLTVLRYGVSL